MESERDLFHAAQVKTHLPEIHCSFLNSFLKVSTRARARANDGMSNTQWMLNTEAALDFQKDVCRSKGLGQERPEWHGCQEFDRTWDDLGRGC